MPSTHRLATVFLLLGLTLVSAALADTVKPKTAPMASSPDLSIKQATVTYLEDLDLLVFEQQVAGSAGGQVPTARGSLDGAPVLAYVFPTTLAPDAAGFVGAEGTLALAVTAHPDFDDTPLWDENGNQRYDDDGVVWHPHWVVLGEDTRVPGGLAVRSFEAGDPDVVLPPTNPGMPMYMDSPGFSVVRKGSTLRVLVPAARVRGVTDFRFDAVTAYLEVSTAKDRPMLGVYQVYTVLSGDLSLPYRGRPPVTLVGVTAAAPCRRGHTRQFLYCQDSYSSRHKLPAEPAGTSSAPKLTSWRRSSAFSSTSSSTGSLRFWVRSARPPSKAPTAVAAHHSTSSSARRTKTFDHPL